MTEAAKTTKETVVGFQEPATNCSFDNALHLGDDIYASVCAYRGSVRLDIRRFINQPKGLLPTVRGIFLSPGQWTVLKTNAGVVDLAIKSVEDGLGYHGR